MIPHFRGPNGNVGPGLDAALTYYRAYQDEVDEKIQENARPLQYWRERYPNLNIHAIEY